MEFCMEGGSIQREEEIPMVMMGVKGEKVQI